jgi:hypothetical protein
MTIQFPRRQHLADQIQEHHGIFPEAAQEHSLPRAPLINEVLGVRDFVL